MKRLPYLILVLILLCSLGCENNYQNCSNIDKYSQDWEALYEVTTEFKDGEIIGIDSSFYCGLIDGATHLRMFKDSQYIVYDTVWRKGTNYIEPLYSGLFQLNNDVLIFKPNNVPKLKDSQKIIKVTNDSLILQSVTVSLGRRLVRNTTFINSHLGCSFDTLSFPKNKIDTVTVISNSCVNGWDGKSLKFTRYDRAFIYNQDTILHLIKDIPSFQQVDKDSLLDSFNSTFRLYDLGEYGEQSAVSGYNYFIINYSFENYITYYHSEDWYDKLYREAQAVHGDCSHKYVTYTYDGKQLLFDDIFKSENKIDVNCLIADAIISYKKKSGWIDEDDARDNDYLGKLFALYTKLNYNDQLVALGKDGIIISLIYGDGDICFAENCVHAIVPYYELKPYLKYPFNKLAK